VALHSKLWKNKEQTFRWILSYLGTNILICIPSMVELCGAAEARETAAVSRESREDKSGLCPKSSLTTDFGSPLQWRNKREILGNILNCPPLAECLDLLVWLLCVHEYCLTFEQLCRTAYSLLRCVMEATCSAHSARCWVLYCIVLKYLYPQPYTIRPGLHDWIIPRADVLMRKTFLTGMFDLR